MIAKLARSLDPGRRRRLNARALLAPANDNRVRTSARLFRQKRRLTCRWHIDATGRLACRWAVEEEPGQLRRRLCRNARRLSRAQIFSFCGGGATCGLLAAAKRRFANVCKGRERDVLHACRAILSLRPIRGLSKGLTPSRKGSYA
jgi:hypothetical protein